MSFLDKRFWISLFHKDKVIRFLIVENNTIVMVGDYGTILISTNNGHSWYSKNSGTSNKLNGIFFVKNTFIAFRDFDTIFISTNNGQNWCLSLPQ